MPAHRLGQLSGGQVRVLERYGGQAHEAVRLVAGHRRDAGVDGTDDLTGEPAIGPVVELRGNDAHRLDVDSGGVHRRQPAAGVGEQRGVLAGGEAGVALGRFAPKVRSRCSCSSRKPGWAATSGNTSGTIVCACTSTVIIGSRTGCLAA